MLFFFRFCFWAGNLKNKIVSDESWNSIGAGLLDAAGTGSATSASAGATTAGRAATAAAGRAARAFQDRLRGGHRRQCRHCRTVGGGCRGDAPDDRRR